MKHAFPGMAAALTVGLISGALLGNYYGRSSDAPDESQNTPSSQVSNESDSTCAKYKDMYDRLRLDFIRLQDNSQSRQSTAICPQPATGQAEVKTATQPVVPDKSPVPPVDEDEPESGEEDKPQETETAKSQPEQLKNDEALAFIASIKGIEQEMGKADTPKKKFKFLDRIRLSKPMQTTDSMPAVSQKDKYLDKLYGVFKGSIQFSSKERKNGRITLVVRKPEEPVDPKAWVVRVDVDNGLGKVSRQHGGMEVLRTVSDGSSAYFLRSSETTYLQMFYRGSSDQFLGNFYEKNSAGEYPKRGTFWLSRKDP